MQRVFERARKADRSLRTRKIKQKAARERGEAWERNQQRQVQVRENRDNIRQARVNRRVDYEAGPLAPRRDIGDKVETYGAYTVFNIHTADKHPKNRLKWWHIVQGDRVVVTKGRERGQINEVQDVYEDKGVITVRDTGMVDVSIPEFLRAEAGSNTAMVSRPRNIPIEDVKLVFPIADPNTGIPRDTIIDRLERLHIKGTKRAQRVIAGSDIIIPWPEQLEEKFEEQKGDTSAENVSRQTFTPFLLHPPMPLSVIDELRHKYSKFRTRFDWDHVAKLEEMDARVERRKELFKTMQTPLQELAELRAKQNQLTRKELTDDQLAVIGAAMAQEKKLMKKRRKGEVLEEA